MKKHFFSGTMQHPSLNTAKRGCDAFRLQLNYSYTRGSWTIASQEPSLSSKGPALSLGSSLTWCASSAPGTSHVYTMETACSSIEHFTLSWPAKKRSLIRSRRGEKRPQYANNGCKAEKQRYSPSSCESSELNSGLSEVPSSDCGTQGIFTMVYKQ